MPGKIVQQLKAPLGGPCCDRGFWESSREQQETAAPQHCGAVHGLFGRRTGNTCALQMWRLLWIWIVA